MFKKNKKKTHLTFASENLAVPEIHTNDEEEKLNDDENTSGIFYDNLAMPEIHFSHNKKSGDNGGK